MQHVTDDFADQIRAFYQDPLDPLAQQFMFRRPPTIGELRRPPQVLLLGNHSSGKSTFINYLLGAEVQKTGVAPTDDSFTIITWGADRADHDGPAVVSNPDLPYQGLRHFGEQLVSHIRLKQRQAELLRTVTLIDSPGMIDEAKAEGGRGYDFPGAVRWLAERADLVIVFFDPDNAGSKTYSGRGGDPRDFMEGGSQSGENYRADIDYKPVTEVISDLTPSVSSKGGSGGSRSGGKSEAQREAEKETNRLLSERDRILRSLETPMQEYERKLADLNRLQEMGELTTAQYNAALGGLEEELRDAEWGAVLEGIESVLISTRN